MQHVKHFLSFVLMCGFIFSLTACDLLGNDDPKDAASAKLKVLSVSGASINFNPDLLVYNIEVANSVNSVTVTAVAEDSAATVTVQAIQALVAGNPVNLIEGVVNPITVVVVAADLKSTCTYILNVDRLESGVLPGSTLLETLVISAGDLDFSGDTTSYSVTVGNDVESVTVTPAAVSVTAEITVNSVEVASAAQSQEIALTAGTDTTITVVVTNGTNSTPYTITVTRQAQSNTVEIIQAAAIGNGTYSDTEGSETYIFSGSTCRYISTDPDDQFDGSGTWSYSGSAVTINVSQIFTYEGETCIERRTQTFQAGFTTGNGSNLHLYVAKKRTAAIDSVVDGYDSSMTFLSILESEDGSTEYQRSESSAEVVFIINADHTVDIQTTITVNDETPTVENDSDTWTDEEAVLFSFQGGYYISEVTGDYNKAE